MRLLLSLSLWLAASGAGYSQCRGLTKRVVPAKQKTLFYSPGYNGPAYLPVSYLRVDRAQHTVLYVVLRVPGDSAALQQGSTVLLADGSRLAWPRRVVGFKTDHGRRVWWAENELTEAQLTQLSTQFIAAVQVHCYAHKLTSEQAQQARAFFNCVREAAAE